MSKHSHPELDGQKPEILYTVQLKRPGQTLRERLTWGAVGAAVGLGVAAAYLWLNPTERPWAWPPTQASATSAVADPFRQGAEQAMAAAELTQTAEFREEWAQVAMHWQQAIVLMQAVPKSSPQASLAQQKVTEYERNLQYAQSNVSSRASRAPVQQSYWTVGSDRDLVMAVQGPPEQSMQYHSACQQTLRYGNSLVELTNGYVRQYDNADGNLKVLAQGPTVLSARAAQGTWTLGAPEADIVRLQGTPTRQEQYTSNRFKTLYYGKNSVLLENGQAIGYLNADGGLKVSVQAPATGATGTGTWSIGASRSEVLRAENQTPTAISRNDTSCEEVFQFGDSEVSFRQGLVTGYRDRGNSLQVQ